MRASLALLSCLGLLFAGCPGGAPKESGTPDCADGDPDAADLCDGVDSDCDGQVDEDADELQWFPDEDEDGYGGARGSLIACSGPDGYVDNGLDCDDEDPDISPDAEEACGGVDEDCDGLTDDDDPSVTGQSSFYLDEDDDGYGAGPSFLFCEGPRGYVYNDLDCDDDDASVGDSRTWYQDGDDDGYGVSTSTAASCDAPDGYVDNADDCDDRLASVNPGEAEVCLNDIDDDCDGDAGSCVPYEGKLAATDAGTVVATSLNYFGAALSSADTDGDGRIEAITSAPYANSYTGVVYIFERLSDGRSGTESLASATLYGSSSLGYLGYGLANGADYDGDGYDDVAAYTASSSLMAVVDGPISVVDGVDRADALVSGPGGVPSINHSWVVAEDLDGDGAASLLFSDYQATSSYSYEGVVYVISSDLASGKVDGSEIAQATIWGNSSNAYLGQDIAPLGDTDGDGVGDFAVGSYYYGYSYDYNGLVGVFSGDVSGSLSLTEADYLIYGRTDSQYLGVATAAVGDLDGDGHPDLALSAYYDSSFTGSSVGATYAFLAPYGFGSVSTARADLSYYGSSTSGHYGIRVAGMDLTGDGDNDLAIGDYNEDSSTGGVYLFYGPYASGSYDSGSADAHIIGSGSSRYFGYSLAGLGDLDNDGYEELGVSTYAEYSFSVFYGGAL